MLSRWLAGAALLAFTLTPIVQADEPAPAPLKVAQIPVKGTYPEGASAPGLFSAISESLLEMMDRLDKAAADDNIKAVVLEIDSPGISWGKVHELRTKIAQVRGKGKKVYAVMTDASSIDYLVASAADEIIMPESGTWMVLGLRAEVTFYKNLFDMLAIKPDMLRVGEFKSAAEPYTRTEMSPEFKLEMTEILDDYYAQLVQNIAKSRNLKEEDVKAAIDAAPLTAAEAKKRGLLDHIAYADQLKEIIQADHDKKAIEITKNYGKKEIDTDFSGLGGMVKMMNMMMGVEPATRKTNTPKIAIISASGMIMTGSNTTDLLGTEVMGADTIIKALKQAEEDATVKAIVLRVDSPGGSALASDLMWRAIQQARKKKPVVASMGDTAASGGYYISMGTDFIYAEPGTLTGSIGVVGGKVAVGGLMEKAGITTSVISRGQHSGILSINDGFSESERAAMQKLMNDIYRQFTEKAAAGRKMEVEKLEKLARGRVYTGTKAKELGLVDELGTLEDAIAKARELAKIEKDAKTDRLLLPKPGSPLEALFGPLDEEARAKNPVSGNAELMLAQKLSPELARHLRALEIVNVLAREPRLTLLPFQLQIK